MDEIFAPVAIKMAVQLSYGRMGAFLFNLP
jgi:hypothetical protein